MTARPTSAEGGAQPWVPATTSLRRLADAAQSCQGCDLFESATQAVFGEGPRAARILLVGEQPGDREDLAGHPFVGPAGALLDRALHDAGLTRDEVYLTNAVKHFRFSGTRGKRRIHQSPARWQVAACQPWLLAELDLVRPEGVVLLGATAVASVWGGRARLADHRARFDPWPSSVGLRRPPRWATATTHPSAVLRSRNRAEDFELLVADLAAVRDHIAR